MSKINKLTKEEFINLLNWIELNKDFILYSDDDIYKKQNSILLTFKDQPLLISKYIKNIKLYNIEYIKNNYNEPFDVKSVETCLKILNLI